MTTVNAIRKTENRPSSWIVSRRSSGYADPPTGIANVIRFPFPEQSATETKSENMSAYPHSVIYTFLMSLLLFVLALVGAIGASIYGNGIISVGAGCLFIGAVALFSYSTRRAEALRGASS